MQVSYDYFFNGPEKSNHAGKKAWGALVCIIMYVRSAIPSR